MSSPEPAPKQTRQDGARQAAVARPAPEQARAPGTSPSPAHVQANGQASDAATTRMVADGEASHDSRWMQLAHGVADGAQIIGEIIRLALFNPFTGTFEGNLELGKALYYAQLVAPIQALQMIALDGANRGSNPVHVRLNLYHKTFDLTAPHLAIAGFHTGTVTGRACELSALTAHAQAGSVTVTIAGATLHDVTFLRGDQQLHAREVGLRGLAATATSGASLETALHFAEAHVHGLVYPNATPLDLDLPGGTSLDAVWQHQAPAATPTSAPGALPPAPDVLPPGSRVQIELTGLQAAAIVAGDATRGQGGFGHLRIALVKDGTDLASIVVTGFHAGGSAAAVGGTIDQLVLTGAPPLVDALLANQQLATDPHVRAAMQLVKSLGIKPALHGSVAFSHVGLDHGAAGERATGDFAATLALPGVGKLDVKMMKFAIGTADGASGGFDHFETTLTDEAGKELGHVDLDGGAAHNPDPKTRTGSVHKFHARGDVAGIVRAGDAIIKQLPLTVRSGFAMVRELGITGDVSGSLTAIATASKTEVTGSFQAHLDAGAVGSIRVDVADFRGSETSAADATFRDFKTTLTNPRGHVVADVHITNGNYVQGAKGATTFKAGKIDAKGDTSSVTAMIGAVEKQAAVLSPPVRVAFGLVRAYYVNGGGTLGLAGVEVTQGAGAAGAQAVRLGRADAAFRLATGEQVAASVSGLHGDSAARGTDVQFDRFDATLASPAGGGHARIVVESGGAQIAAPAKHAAGATPDFSVHGHHATFEGQVVDISKLVTGIRAHLGALPAPLAAAFDVVGRYATAQTNNQVAADVSATDFAMSAAHGSEASHGDVSARVALAGDVVQVAVHGFVGDGSDVKFTGLELAVQGDGGQVAASLQVGSTHLDRQGAVTVASITAMGDATRLRKVVDALGSRVPEAVTRALAAVGTSRIDAAISSISVAPTTGGGLVTDAAVLRVTAGIMVSAGDTVYRSPNAALAIFGAHVTLGPDKKPREIDASRLEVTGTFSSLGAGRALDGNATIHTGAAKILFDATGAVQSVQAGQLQVTGDVTRTTTPAPAATSAATAQPTRAQQLASHDHVASEATTAAQAIKSADIQAHTPIQAGRYGSGLVHIDVPSGATIQTSLQVRDYALTNGTRIVAQPKLEGAAWLKAAGVDLETAGTQGALELRLDGFFDQNLTKYVVGKTKLSLDLGTLVGEVMGKIRGSIEAAAATAQKGASPAARDDGLAKKHDKWAASAARHTAPRQRTKDAADEPRSMAVGDLATQGIQAALTTGVGDLELASRDGQIDAHLHGEAAGGGVMRLAASDAHVQVAGQTVDAQGVDTGAVNIATQGDTTHVQLTGFSIETLRWLGS